MRGDPPNLINHLCHDEESKYLVRSSISAETFVLELEVSPKAPSTIHNRSDLSGYSHAQFQAFRTAQLANVLGAKVDQ